MIKKISLVTGCAGFIGSHVVDYLLSKGHKVIGVDNFVSGKLKNISLNLNNKNFIFISADVSNINKILIKKNISKIDFVFHFAGYGELIPSIEKPLEYFVNNSLNTVKLLDFIRRKYKIIKFIYAASSSCYGINNKKTKESSTINIEHPYGFSKYIGEQACLHWGKVFKLPVISIRIFNAYGPRSRTTNVYGAVIGVFLKQKLSKHPLTVVGDGKQKRDFLYISDLCEAFYKAANSSYVNEVFNLGYGKAQTVLKLAHLIDKKIVHIPWRPGEPRKTEANINKIKRYLNWKPRISLEQGIKNVINDIGHWKKAPLWTRQKIKLATKNWMKFLK
jgi:UDP-glucose 4-epimerase